MIDLDIMARWRNKVCAVWTDGAREALPVTCRAGCPACCHQIVMVQPFEAEILARVLTPARLALAVSQGERQLAAADESPSEAAARAWFARAEPCVFLGSDGMCSIYEERPAACRLFLTTSPAEMCSPLALAVTQRVDAAEPLQRVAEMEQHRSGQPRWRILGLALQEVVNAHQ